MIYGEISSTSDFQVMDNYISEFSLNVLKKINNDKDLEINANIGFRIVDIDENYILENY